MTFVESRLAGPARKNGQIKIHGPEHFEGMRRAGKLTAQVLDMLAEHVRPGVTTQALDDFVFDIAMAHGAYPAPLDYRGYRKSICTSINHVVCHGIPDEKPLREGDIVNIDVTVFLNGYHGDTSRTFFVGKNVSQAAKHLVAANEEALREAIKVCRMLCVCWLVKLAGLCA